MNKYIKYFIFLLIVIVVLYSISYSIINYETETYSIVGVVEKVEYIQGGFGSRDKTILYMKDERVIPLREHHAIRLNKRIVITIVSSNSRVKLIEYESK